MPRKRSNRDMAANCDSTGMGGSHGRSEEHPRPSMSPAVAASLREKKDVNPVHGSTTSHFGVEDSSFAEEAFHDGSEINDVVNNRVARRGRSRCGVSDLVIEDFFDRLPANGFTAEEELFRVALLDALISHGGRARLAVVSGKLRHLYCAFLPQGVTLATWVERRLANHVCLELDKDKQVIAQIIQEPLDERSGKRRRRRQDIGTDGILQKFISELPEDRLSEEEECLCDALIESLKHHGGYARLAVVAGKLKEVQHAVLPQGVTLAQWVEHRIANYVQIQLDESKQVFARLISQASANSYASE